MPNSEVKRRSADGSVGSPHARVGNCQTSNKAKGPIERLGLFAFISLHLSLHGKSYRIMTPTRFIFGL
uniref:hypothetical protein n=1 Tax=Salmonella enterica TaxID=28901 RepID=UPI001BAEBC22